jgi:hypothetical protein
MARIGEVVDEDLLGAGEIASELALGVGDTSGQPGIEVAHELDRGGGFDGHAIPPDG